MLLLFVLSSKSTSKDATRRSWPYYVLGTRSYYRGSWHRYERSIRTLLGFPHVPTASWNDDSPMPGCAGMKDADADRETLLDTFHVSVVGTFWKVAARAILCARLGDGLAAYPSMGFMEVCSIKVFKSSSGGTESESYTLHRLRILKDPQNTLSHEI